MNDKSNDKSIAKIAPAKFKVSTLGVAGSELELDFNPIIEKFGLSGDFTLIHWQAKPKGHREWGIYSSKDDSYRSIVRIVINSPVESLQLDDATTTSIPSAVVFSEETQITCINDKTILGKVFLSDMT